MGSEFLVTLMETTLASSLAIALVLVLRRPLRRFAGAGIAYAAWASVPLAAIAVLLPESQSPVAGPMLLVDAWHTATSGVVDATQTIGVGTAMSWSWLIGALAFSSVLVIRQVRFLHRLQRRDESGEEPGEPLGPAVVGLLRPRIVLPADFAQRYTPEEQVLVLEHEREHLRRGDLPAQALCSLLCCLFWFNPLVHLGAARFRFDQELACDADVIRAFPNSRRTYGDAMFKTQLAGFGLPLGCHWQSVHPLKERIAMLRQPLPGLLRRRSGLALLAVMFTIGTYTVWAAQPAKDPAPVPTLQAVTDEDVLANPKYPAEAAAAGINGQVVLDLLVGADGMVKEIKITSSEPAGVFDKAATTAASGWRFNAGRNGAPGHKVEGWVRVPVQFTHDLPPAEFAPD